MPIAPTNAHGAVHPAAEMATPPKPRFGALLEQRSAQGRSPSPPADAVPAALELAKGIEQAQRRLDAALEAARHGRTFTARELLLLQAQAYRYSQTIDIASKIVEHGAQTVKQAVNTQV